MSLGMPDSHHVAVDDNKRSTDLDARNASQDSPLGGNRRQNGASSSSIRSTLKMTSLTLQCSMVWPKLTSPWFPIPLKWDYVEDIKSLGFQMPSRISMRGYVRPSVHPFVRPSIRLSLTHELKPCRSAVFYQDYYHYERERILRRVSGLVLLKYHFSNIYCQVFPWTKCSNAFRLIMNGKNL